MFCISNICLSLLYYDADYTGKHNISSACLVITDIMSLLQSTYVVLFLVAVTIIRYMALIELEKSQKILEEE